MTAEEKILRGAEAEQLLQNPLLADAFASVESGLMKAWLDVPANSTPEMREGIYLQVQALRAAQRVLTKWISDGKFEVMTIEKRDAEAARMAAAVGGSGTT